MGENKTPKSMAYDIEIFPNFFSVVFFDLTTGASPRDVSLNYGFKKKHPDISAFVIAKDFGVNDHEHLKNFMDDHAGWEFVGFNNIGFDNPILDFVVSRNPTNMQLFDMGQKIISRWNGGEYFQYYPNYSWNQIDLMKMMAFDNLGVSLKQCSINLQWHRVQDLPFEYDFVLEQDDLPVVLDYNLNDVLITSELWYTLQPELEMRRGLSEQYGINFLSASDSQIANLMFNSIYTKSANTGLDELDHLRTKRDLVWLGECIGKNVRFKTKTLQDLLKEVANTVVVKENKPPFSFKYHLEFGGVEYDIGVGGLHSVDKSRLLKASPEYILRDADVGSYYPSIIINENISPKHVDGDIFVRVLGQVTKERLAAKEIDPNSPKALGLKITINSVFGKLNSDTFWLEDAKAMLSVTLSGQLYLLMLIEMLYLKGIPTISANTDGVVCKIPTELEDVYYATCKEWEQITGFTLDYTDYSMIVSGDVNNYITVKSNGKTKEKGRCVTEIGLKRGYRYPVVPRAIKAFFVDGVPVRDFIRSCDNVYDFCISQKTGKDFKMFLSENPDLVSTSNAGLPLDSTPKFLQKNNRYVVVKKGGSRLFKRNMSTGAVIGLNVEQDVLIVNDVDESLPISSYNIDYDYYEEEANKFIKEVLAGNPRVYLPKEELGDSNFSLPEIDKKKDIKILPALFRYSSSSYRYSEDDGVIYRGVNTINSFSGDTGDALYSLRDKKFPNFLSFLMYCDRHLVDENGRKKVNSRHMTILIKLGYFKEFGGSKRLLPLFEEYKRIYKPDQTVNTKRKKLLSLINLWKTTPDESYSVREQIEAEMEILGSPQTIFKEYPNHGYVLDVDTRSAPKVTLYSLSKGTTADIKIWRRSWGKNGELCVGEIFQWNPASLERKEAVRPDGDGGWVGVPGKWNIWVGEYRHVDM